MKKLFIENKNNPWFWLFIGIAVILFVLMPMMSRSAGNSGDEDKFQIPQGRFVMNYYKTDKQDSTCLQNTVFLSGKDQSWNLKYYGCSFDVVTEWINETFGIEDIAKTRHACNALLGWIIVFFGGMIAFRIGGWRAGVFAMLLLFFSPRLLGHSFNNPKDIPLAAGVTMALYYMLMFFRQITPRGEEETSSRGKTKIRKVLYPEMAFTEKTTRIIALVLILVSAIVLFATVGVGLGIVILLLELVALLLFKDAPKFNPLTLMMLALSIALAVSIRIGGLIIVGYMGLWGLLWLIRYGKKCGGQTVSKTILVAIAVCAVGFFGGLLLWPYAMQNPIHNSIESFKLMSQFDVSLRQLFEGQMAMSNTLPWYYTPKFMIMTIPIAVMIGWLLYPFFGAFKKERRMESIMIYFCFLFPVFWIVYTGANVYGGWRHSLFTYPPMAIAAGLGFDALAAWAGSKSKKRVVEVVVSLVPFLLLVPPVLHTVRNHPYEYVYFNELAGGTKNAFGKYEMDYYYHSMREATEWVMANAEPKPNGEKTIIGSWHIESTRYFMRTDTTHFVTKFTRWDSRYEFDWDYLVFPITGISADQLTSAEFPPKDCVHTIDVDDVPIALILKRQTKDDLRGIEQLRANNIDSAIVLFDRALQVMPTNQTALAKRTVAVAFRNAQQGDLDAALGEINAMLDKGQMDNDLMNLYVNIQMSRGTDQNTAVYNFYMAYIAGLEKTGQKAKADEVRKQLGIPVN